MLIFNQFWSYKMHFIQNGFYLFLSLFYCVTRFSELRLPLSKKNFEYFVEFCFIDGYSNLSYNVLMRSEKNPNIHHQF